MIRIHMVRHGRAEAGWNDALDPGLDAIGQAQAAAVASALVAQLAGSGPLEIFTSPLRRCRETAAPLAEAWSSDAQLAAAVAEIPSPEGVPLGERVPWLRQAMTGTWADLGPTYTRYRDGVIEFLHQRTDDVVIFSHFVAINAAIGAAIGDDRLVIYSLDNCSVTTLAVDDGALRLLNAGRQADTLIR